MDADVIITVAFCLEVLLFGLVAGVSIDREAGKARALTERAIMQAVVASGQPAGSTRREPVAAAAGERARLTTLSGRTSSAYKGVRTSCHWDSY